MKLQYIVPFLARSAQLIWTHCAFQYGVAASLSDGGHAARRERVESYSTLTLTSSTKNSVGLVLPDVAVKTSCTVWPANSLRSALIGRHSPAGSPSLSC